MSAAQGRDAVKAPGTIGFALLPEEAEMRAEARAAVLAELRAKVELLVEEAGGRCVKPDDYDDSDGVGICATHAEVMYGDEGYCEDQPRALLRVLALLDEAAA